MFNSQKNPAAAQIEQLAAEVDERTKDLVDAKLAQRRHQNRLTDLRALLDETPNSKALAAETAAAELEAGRYRDIVDAAAKAVASAERRLDLARTAPLRRENVQKVHHSAKRFEDSLPAAKRAIATVIEALDHVSPDFTIEVGPQMFREHMRNAYSALVGGDAERLIAAMRARADAIESGEAPAGLHPRQKKPSRCVARAERDPATLATCRLPGDCCGFASRTGGVVLSSAL